MELFKESIILCNIISHLGLVVNNLVKSMSTQCEFYFLFITLVVINF